MAVLTYQQWKASKVSQGQTSYAAYNAYKAAAGGGGTSSGSSGSSSGGHSGSSGGGGSSSGGGGGGSDAAKAYKRILKQAGVPITAEVKAVIQWAVKNKATGTEFQQQLRLKATSSYMRSRVGIKEVDSMKALWGKLFPHVPMSKGTLAKAIQNEWSAQDILYQSKQARTLMRRLYPGVTIGEFLSGEMSPSEYRDTRREINNEFLNYAGRLMTRGELRSIFKNHVTKQDMLRNLQIAMVAQAANAWDTGQTFNADQMNKIVFGRGFYPEDGGPTANRLRRQAATAAQRQAGYLGSGKQVFEAQRSKRSNVVNPYI